MGMEKNPKWELSDILGFMPQVFPWSVFLLAFIHETRKLESEARGASLVAQWLRICLPMQGTRVRALVWEDPTCRGATKPVSHSY